MTNIAAFLFAYKYFSISTNESHRSQSEEQIRHDHRLLKGDFLNCTPTPSSFKLDSEVHLTTHTQHTEYCLKWLSNI